MSRIRRLSVRGIRNFGDESEESSIRFSRPLTLILGPNGTGKTTIIEALKYATTGDFPPGTDKGKGFIHDPVLSGASPIRGVVKAEVFDAVGNLYTICRTIESIRTGTTTRFKTLDNTLTRVNKGTKQKISITNRCANVDAELSIIMGVSKSILNYVIFCHQEELSWPLDEGKKLKERFDEIFDSARFNKALEMITKYSKEMKEDIRVLKAERDTLFVIVGEVKDKESKLADSNRRLESLKQKIDDINNELQPLTMKMKDIEKLDSDHKNLLVEEEKKQLEYDVSKQQFERLQESIQNIFEGTTEELKEHINSYDEMLIRKENEILEFEGKLKNISKEDNKITSLLGEQRVKVGTLKQQVQDQEKRIVLRNKMLNEALSAWKLNAISPNISETEVVTVMDELEQKMRELEQTTETNQLQRDQEEKGLQIEVDMLRTEHSKIESEMQLKDKEVTEIREETSKIRSQILQIGAASNKYSTIEIKLQNAKERIDELNKIDVDVIKKEVQDKINSRNKIETLLNRIDEEIAALHKQSSLQTELELHKAAICIKEEEIEKLKDKCEDEVKMLLEVQTLPQTKVKTKLDLVQEKLTNKTRLLMQELQTEQRRFTTLETTIKHQQNELKKKKHEIESHKEKISSICHYKNFDEILLLQSRKVKDLQDRRGMFAYQSTAYREYVKQLKEKDPCCPLCHRDFGEQKKVLDLINEMESEMENHPNRLQQCECELKEQQEKYDNMLQLKPIVERITHFEESELKQLEEKLEEMEKRLLQLEIRIKELETSKAIPERKLAKYKEIISSIMLWDRYIDEIQELKRTINNVQNRLADAGIKSTRTIKEAQEQRESLKLTLKTMREDIDQLQQNINVYNEKLQNARSAYNVLHEEQLKIRSDMQKLQQLRDKQSELYSRESILTGSVQTLRQKLVTADNELEMAIERLERTKKENREKLAKDRQLMTEGSRRLSELQKVQNEIDNFEQRKVSDVLACSELKIRNYETLISELTQEKSKTDKGISKLKEEITSQEIRKRDLTDNIALRKIKNSMNSLKQQCLDLREKIKKINHDRILEEWQELRNREESLFRQKNVAKGNQEELERVIAQYTADLNKETYRMAKKNYKNKCIELTVQEEAVLNLKTYGKVLDRAMIEYHEERMSTVNKIMQRLWKLIYTGSDTSSIQIRTEATEGVGSARRTYNYKLVQTKHGHEMDMRGRCSAGQKVLASIIIRLALAETFCKDCGILALDEPTTNLDEENTNSLADALATIIKLRSQYQKNFQLVIISHDEKFLFKLASLSNNKGFYELFRKYNGLTSIRYCQVDEGDTASAKHIKEEMDVTSEDESQQESSNAQSKLKDGDPKLSSSSQESNQKKRFNRDNGDEDSHQNRPSKKRHVFHM